MKNLAKSTATFICGIAIFLSISSCSEKMPGDTNTDGQENGNAESSYESVVTELHCKSEGIDIYGLMYTPKAKAGKLPLIILSHSSSLTHAAMVPYAEYLSEKGYAAYCYDFCGACDSSKSKGRTTDEMTVFTEVDDLKIVLDKMKTLDYIDTDNVFVLGSSQGGLVTALVAEERPFDIQGMILFYPAFNIPDMIEQFSSFGNMGMSDAFVKAMKGYNVYANIGKYLNDIIIIHGTSDFIVNIKYSEKAVTKYKSAVLYPIQNANHGFNNENLNGMASMLGGEKDDIVMPYVFDYLRTHINK